MHRFFFAMLAVASSYATAAPVEPPAYTKFDGVSVNQIDANRASFSPALFDPLNCSYYFSYQFQCDRVTSASLGLGELSIQYQGGTTSQRVAEVTTWGTNNRALRFALYDKNVSEGCPNAAPCKGRVQMNAYNLDRLRSFYYSAYMFLPANDFNALKLYDRAFDWLTISEWWNNAGWDGTSYPFRIKLDITKPSAAPGGDLVFRLRGQRLVGTSYVSDWDYSQTNYPIPLGQWLKLEYYFVEGNDTTGRFYFAVTPAGGARSVVFDVRGRTYDPADPAPDGLTKLNPLKLYTSAQLIEHMQQQGATLQVIWDNLDFRTCRSSQGLPEIQCPPDHIQ